MTEETKTVRTFVNAINQGDIDGLRRVLDDGFEFRMAGTPVTADKEGFVGMVENLRTAFPDWNFDNVNFTSKENPVKATIDTTGTHKGPLDMSVMGGGTVDATGKSFMNEQEPVTWVVEDGKIVKHSVDSPTGGVVGMLTQLGIEPPTPPTE